MADRVSQAVRSKIMASVGTHNTGPELMLRKRLHRLGYRYAIHSGKLPGKPDLVFPSLGKVVFVHGCFWHGHTCRWGRLPKSRPEYWQPKVAANRARHARVPREVRHLRRSVLAIKRGERELFLPRLNGDCCPASHIHMNKLPHSQQLMEPVLVALAALGGSGSIDEIREKIISDLSIPDSLANLPHRSNRGSGGRTELDYRLAWAKTYLKQRGYAKNSARGIWSLGPNASKNGALSIKLPPGPAPADEGEKQTDWHDQLVTVLTDELTPAAFERLVQRILRETGFAQVEVTGRTGDGGIDGKGIAKINGILSFHVVFQCKRYKKAVSTSEIRDFRGAMQGRADKGLFITTGYFTRDAIREATRDGAITIDLVDGEKLALKLKELGLGVTIETTEKITVDSEWFSKL